MKKKYIIHDEDGTAFKVEETIDEEPIEETVKEEEIKTHDESLDETEISALKKLAAVADKLIAFVSSKETQDEDEEVIEHLDDEDEEIEEKSEEVIDTDEEIEEKSKAYDSKKSFNSIETRKKKTSDSIDPSEEINAAWAKRLNRR